MHAPSTNYKVLVGFLQRRKRAAPSSPALLLFSAEAGVALCIRNWPRAEKALVHTKTPSCMLIIAADERTPLLRALRGSEKMSALYFSMQEINKKLSKFYF
jgi:hypothetical protein